jgi:uncharacterized protein with FMN-binding domain
MKAGRRRALHGMIAVCLAATVPHSVVAQIVHGTVSDSIRHQPIAGAVVTLVDAGGNVLDRNITSELGEYSFAIRGSTRALRVVRIGFQPVEIPLTSAAVDRSLDIAMGPFATPLATVRITDRPGCPRTAEGAAGFALWEQARAALLNSVIARSSNPMSVHRLYFGRALDAKTGGITRFTVSEDFSESAKTSFTSLRSPVDLMRLGFAGDTQVVGYMFGPDAELLSDDAFARAYCFRLAAPDKTRPNQIGVAFSAVDFAKRRVDLDGTLWMDTVARTLRDVEFRYVGMPHEAEQFHPGGRISFATGANGVVFIDSYSLHLIGNAPYPIYSPQCRTSCGMHDSFYPNENGAEVSHLRWRDGQRWDGHLGTVNIRATMAGGRPAARTVLQLADTHYRGTADANGAVRIVDLLPGPYAVRVNDPRLKELGITIPTSLKFSAARDSVVQLSLDVPTVEDFIVSECKNNKQWNAADSTFLIGRVVDSDKNPIADARVTFAVRKDTVGWVWEKEALKTGADGVFEACATTLAPGRKVQVRVEGEHLWTRDVTRDISDKATIMSPIRLDAKTRP